MNKIFLESLKKISSQQFLNKSDLRRAKIVTVNFEELKMKIFNGLKKTRMMISFKRNA